jgi:hypothetical protein
VTHNVRALGTTGAGNNKARTGYQSPLRVGEAATASGHWAADSARLILAPFKKGNPPNILNAVHGRADVSKSLRYGYRTNEAGFGWTNAVFTALFDELPPAQQRKPLNKP